MTEQDHVVCIIVAMVVIAAVIWGYGDPGE